MSQVRISRHGRGSLLLEGGWGGGPYTSGIEFFTGVGRGILTIGVQYGVLTSWVGEMSLLLEWGKGVLNSSSR